MTYESTIAYMYVYTHAPREILIAACSGFSPPVPILSFAFRLLQMRLRLKMTMDGAKTKAEADKLMG